MLLGTLCVVFVGLMPGLSSVMGLSIMLPVALSVGGNAGILMMLAIFCSAIYGGSITAILINTPGTANSAATALDGYAMTKKGEPGRALGISTFSSMCGGLLSALCLMWTAPLLAKYALQFGPAEYFALGVFGLSMVASVSSGNVFKGVISAIIGLFLATVGMESMSGVNRFTFGSLYLTGGISYIPVLIGLFAFSQGLISTEENYGKENKNQQIPKINHVFPFRDMKAILPSIVRSSFIGILIGAIPGTGGDIASWVSYNEAKRWSKHPDEFGTGVPEGIAAPEAGNNAITGGALIPLLTLGIPGDAGSAVILGALLMMGIVPGPLLFSTQGDKVYIIIIGFLVANLLMALVGFLGIRFFAKMTTIPDYILIPVIFIFCFVGSYAMNNSIGDVYVMIVAGVLGYFMLKMGLNIPPLILGLLLGNMLESNLRRVVTISRGALFSFFLHRPIAVVLLLISFLSLFFLPFLSALKKRKQKRQA